MTNDTLFLETSLLNSFVNEDNWTYVQIGEGFVRKKTRDIQEGDLTVLNKLRVSDAIKVYDRRVFI